MKRVALVMMLGGCSFAATQRPEPGKQCNTSEASPIIDASWAALYGIGAIAAYQETRGEWGDDDGIPIAIASGALSALFAVSAVRGFSNIGQCRRHNQQLYDEYVASQTEAAQPARPSARDDAWKLTKEAAEAARRGDCATTSTLGQVVIGMDPEFHATVFMRDAAIARCFAQPAPPPAAQPAVEPTSPTAPGEPRPYPRPRQE